MNIARCLHVPANAPELVGLVERWPTLPEHIKAAILALAATVKT